MTDVPQCSPFKRSSDSFRSRTSFLLDTTRAHSTSQCDALLGRQMSLCFQQASSFPQPELCIVTCASSLFKKGGRQLNAGPNM